MRSVTPIWWDQGSTLALDAKLHEGGRVSWKRTYGGGFVSDPTGHLTATFTLHREEGDFVARNAWNLVASDDEWTAPILAQARAITTVSTMTGR